MKTAVGILSSLSDAERIVERLRTIGVKDENINLLSPKAAPEDVGGIPMTDTEQTGIGPLLGGVVGAALGAAEGMGLGAAMATMFIPAVGPVLSLGLLGAAVFAAGGAASGVLVGAAVEDAQVTGLPIDDLFVYEDALRRGRTVVMVFADTDAQAEQAREMMREAGAATVDAAREAWWAGLRDVEKAHFEKQDFDELENIYRRGFEGAQHPSVRGKSYCDAVGQLSLAYPSEYSEDSFRRGYERGREHYNGVRARHEHPLTTYVEGQKEATYAGRRTT